MIGPKFPDKETGLERTTTKKDRKNKLELNSRSTKIKEYCIFLNNSWEIIDFFAPKGGQLFEGGDYFKYV